jgi:hypothetical protein
VACKFYLIFIASPPFLFRILKRKRELKRTDLFNSVMIISALRIQALNLVNSNDVTYSKCYLGLLSEVGAFLTIVTCCAPFSEPVIKRCKPYAEIINSLLAVIGCNILRAPTDRSAETSRNVERNQYLYRLSRSMTNTDSQPTSAFTSKRNSIITPDIDIEKGIPEFDPKILTIPSKLRINISADRFCEEPSPISPIEESQEKSNSSQIDTNKQLPPLPVSRYEDEVIRQYALDKESIHTPDTPRRVIVRTESNGTSLEMEYEDADERGTI